MTDGCCKDGICTCGDSCDCDDDSIDMSQAVPTMPPPKAPSKGLFGEEPEPDPVPNPDSKTVQTALRGSQAVLQVLKDFADEVVAGPFPRGSVMQITLRIGDSLVTVTTRDAKRVRRPKGVPTEALPTGELLKDSDDVAF